MAGNTNLEDPGIGDSFFGQGAESAEGKEGRQSLAAVLHDLRIKKIALELEVDDFRQRLTRANEALARYMDLYENAPVAFVSLDREAMVHKANLAARNMFEVDRAPFIAFSLRERVAPEAVPVLDSFLALTVVSGQYESCEISFTGKSEVFAHMVGLGSGEEGDDCLVALVDITEREKARKIATRTLEEKSMLMKELQHRVKNNLNVVYSLLGLGQSQISDPNAIAVLEKSRGRIIAMSHIYEQLYSTGNALEVDLKTYFERLLETIFETYSVDGSRFHLAMDLHPVTLDAQRASLAGLMFSELISNATKYAGSGRESVEVSISLNNVDKQIALCVSDNGPGLPPGLDPTTSESMGFSLLRMLAEQMRAALSIRSTPGKGVSVTLLIEA